ncbi:cytochrome-c oxidase [Dacryopinax primogenitus]|uniref:Cytochrome c oxidase subunit 9, mitochondrial n=1 Tax=Dacryopinax primogenitus (strain DJM 731) TaxID=1858805 RepID=M5G6H1_DACPD|nr:cytochrome-c oxidase [Dacryopinax primogenitus]EJU03805.1 cytochrome-c oxidase [Dacryopinax primogenitus]
MQPIVGKLRKRLVLDITCSIGLGLAMGYSYWYGVHLPAVRRRDDYYMKLEREKQALTA